MSDTIEFKLIDYAENAESRADSEEACSYEDSAAAIYLNGRELIDILEEIEKPFAEAEGHPDLSGSYAYRPPQQLYRVLTEALIEGTYQQKYGAELLCCKSCGDPGCWSVEVKIRRDEEFVYWESFGQNHRKSWKYNLSYKFDRAKYESEVEKLKDFAEES